MTENAKKLRPTDVDTLAKKRNSYESITTLRKLVQFKEVPFPNATEDTTACRFTEYNEIAASILRQTLTEFDHPQGSLNKKATHRRASNVVQQLKETEIKELGVLRDELFLHLCEHCHALSRAPPLSGGDTSLASIGYHFWVLVCLLNCVLLRFGLGQKEYTAFNPCRNAYLRAQRLTMDRIPVEKYSVRLLQLSVHNYLERLNALSDYHESLDEYAAALRYRASELICGSGKQSPFYDAPEWCSTIAAATTGQTAEPSEMDKSLLTCNINFIVQSMVWFTSIHNYTANYYLLALPPIDGPTTAHVATRYSIDQSRTIRWFPSHALLYRVLEFFCNYANGCTDDTYLHGLRNFCTQFEMTPDQPAIYRIYQKTTTAIPADVLGYQFSNQSFVGKEYVRLIKFSRTSLLEWMHQMWNWRHGETRVRSSYLGTDRFITNLVVLYVIDLFFSNRLRMTFRKRFVLYQSSPAFVAMCVKGQRSGSPFIVQQFGYWSVFVPHLADPTMGTFPVDTTLAARAAAAIPHITKFTDAESDSDERSESDDIDDPAGDRKRKRKELSWTTDPANDARKDERGDDIAVDRTDGGLESARNYPTTDFCRTYDCESFLEAFTVWLIALLHIRKGVVGNVDLSHFTCDLLGWPHPEVTDDVDVAVDAVVE